MQTESLDFYWKLAKKLIMVHGYSALLKDNENIGYVATALIKADIDFDPKIGIIEGYRSMHGKYAILKLINKLKKVKKEEFLDDKNVKSYKDQSQNVVDCEDLLTFVNDNKIISNDILEQIKDRYLNNYSWNEIATKFKITKQSAKLNVKRGIIKIRKRLCM